MATGPALPKSAYTSVFELARSVPNSAAFNRLFELSLGKARCKATPQLSAKYGVAQDNSQAVLRVSNRVTLAQCWFNEDRTKKPQTFSSSTADQAAAFDPLAPGGSGSCDFCSWPELTAEERWGRVEGPHAVSASNLFKYVKPQQGVILFKHHDPLNFTLEQLQDLVNVSNQWFQQAAAHQAQEDAALALPHRQLHPLFVWNCLPRAGASQVRKFTLPVEFSACGVRRYHGHAQVLLSDQPFPTLQQEAESVAEYNLTHGTSYYQDVLAAHQDVGLLLRDGSQEQQDFAFAVASLTPWKDMEVCIHGSSMASTAFQRLLYTAVRALTDELGVRTFNASIQNIPLPKPSNGSSSGGGGTGGAAAGGAYLQPGRGVEVPVVARVVARGTLANLASDFGGLEVFGGASIGHTDPFRVVEALRQVQASLASDPLRKPLN